MENKLTYKGKELKWGYKIVPCLECPIYPLRKEWEDHSDIRKDKCYTSRCTYNKIVAESLNIIIYSEENEKEL